MRAYTHTHTHTHMNIPPCRCRHPRVRERLARVWLRQGLPRHQGEAHRRRSGVCVCLSVCLSLSLSLCVCVPVCACGRAGGRACVFARVFARARICTHMYNSVHTQVLSGTGGGRVAFEFMARFVGKNTPIYMPDPTWANHLPMAKDAGLSLATYR